MWGFFLSLSAALGIFLWSKSAQASLPLVDNVIGSFLPQPDIGLNIPDIVLNVDSGGLNVGFDNMNGDIDTLARTAWGEARGGGSKGMQAVINCVINRYAAAQETVAYAQLFGSTISDICRKPAQFSAWNANDPNFGPLQIVTAADPQFQTALALAEQAVNGSLPDITGGALYYRGIGASLPGGIVVTASVGGNTFFNYA